MSIQYPPSKSRKRGEPTILECQQAVEVGLETDKRNYDALARYGSASSERVRPLGRAELLGLSARFNPVPLPGIEMPKRAYGIVLISPSEGWVRRFLILLDKSWYDRACTRAVAGGYCDGSRYYCHSRIALDRWRDERADWQKQRDERVAASRAEGVAAATAAAAKRGAA